MAQLREHHGFASQTLCIGGNRLMHDFQRDMRA